MKMNISYNRILKELKNINEEELTDGHISAGPKNKNDIYHWEAIIFGPEDSLYNEGIFKLDIKIPDNYPFSPPKIKFITKIYHPNIGIDGTICLDILKADIWSPSLTIFKVLLSICSLLTDPNEEDPLNKIAANMYIKDKELYKKKVKSWTLRYAVK